MNMVCMVVSIPLLHLRISIQLMVVLTLPLSPYNPYTSTPPTIYLRGQRVGFLSKNKYLFGSIDPDSINTWMQNNGLYY